MDINQIHQSIIDFCIDNQNPEIVKKYSRYFKEGYDAYGLTTELMHSKRDEIENLNVLSFDSFAELSRKLITGSKYEEPAFAILLLRKFFAVSQKESFNLISEWYNIGINNWAHSDVLCSEYLTKLVAEGDVLLSDFDEWKTSERPFKRRAVPVAQLKNISDDNSLILAYIADMMHDSERVVHQGLGWLLRELWKKNATQTEDFLLLFKDSSPRLIFQYACEKMSKEDKLKFKKLRI